jgi:dGTPase
MAPKNIIRQELEAKEAAFLAPYATQAAESLGRRIPEKKCFLRTDFQRDRDRIVHTKAFRRLKHKTQVFIAPRDDHYRTRLTHTLEVSQISRVICRALELNEDLAEAIALGHDLGHTPFGHSGEEVLDECLKKEGSRFFHNQQSLRVIDILEKDGRGLNLTWEVRDGVLCHPWNWPELPVTAEGQVVRMADQIAFINHDIEDALMAEIISISQLPKKASRVLGYSHGERINSLVADLIFSSRPVLEKVPKDKRRNKIALSLPVRKAMEELRRFLYSKVYIGSAAKKEEEKTKGIVRTLYNYYIKNPGKIPKKYPGTKKQRVIDYIAGMTDDYAIAVFNKLFIPTPWVG